MEAKNPRCPERRDAKLRVRNPPPGDVVGWPPLGDVVVEERERGKRRRKEGVGTLKRDAGLKEKRRPLLTHTHTTTAASPPDTRRTERLPRDDEHAST